MRVPEPKANTTTEAYLAYKAGYLEESELKPVLYKPYLHFDAWLAYWAGLTSNYPVKNVGKNLFNKNQVYDGWINNTGVLEPNDVWQFSGYIPVSPNTAYTVSCSRKEGSTGILQLKYASYTNTDESSFVETYGVNGVETLTYTTPSTCHYIRVGYRKDRQENIQLEEGSTATSYESYTGEPEMLTDEEALVAYLAGVTDTYPEEIKDPYDVRIVGYLKYLVSARWGRPEYPVNNEEFYLSTMNPPVVTNDTPSADMELDDTAEAPFIDVKAYGDTDQQTYTGRNLTPYPYAGGGNARGITIASNNDGSVTLNGQNDGTGQTTYFLFNDASSPITMPAGTYYVIPSTDTNVGLMVYDTNGGYHGFNNGSSYTQTLSADITVRQIYVTVTQGAATNFNNFKFYPMITTKASPTVEDYEPYVGGIPAPNPSYPQDIHTVTGAQTVVVNVKNYFNADGNFSYGSTNQKTFSNGDGTVTSTSNFSQSRSAGQRIIGLKPNTEYTLSVTLDSYEGNNPEWAAAVQVLDRSSGANVVIGNTMGYPAPDGVPQTLTKTFTTPADVSAIWVSLNGRTSSGDARATFSHIQLEEGPTATDYDPHYGSYELNLGKNLLDQSTFVQGSIDPHSGADMGSSKRIRSPFIPVKGGTYTVSNGNGFYIVVDAYGKDKSFLPAESHTYWQTTSVFTFDVVNAKYVRILFRKADEADITPSELTSAQLECGSIATEYSPYFEPIELCKIGDYQDYIYKGDDGWYLHKDINKRIVKGNSGTVSNTGTNRFNIDGAFGDYKMIHQDITYAVADSYIVIGQADSNSMFNTLAAEYDYCMDFSRGSTYTMRFKDISASTSGDFITKLNNNPVTVYYVLGTATDTLITNSALVAQLDALVEGGSYDGKTYIKVTATDPNLPALLKVEAAKYA